MWGSLSFIQTKLFVNFCISQTTAHLYIAINWLPWTLPTLCGDISVTFIMPLLTRLSHFDMETNLTEHCFKPREKTYFDFSPLFFKMLLV